MKEEKTIKIKQVGQFEKSVKKLHSNQKSALDNAVEAIKNNPHIGQQKKGDLGMIRVYKFRMVNQQTLLGYTYDKANNRINLIEVGPHENFYQKLKR